MGRWFIINLDKHEYTSYMDLGTSLFLDQGGFSDILLLLIRPIGTFPLNLTRLRSKVKKWNEEMIEDGCSRYLQSPKDKRPDPKSANSASPSSTLGIFSKLPTEVITMVAEELETYRDIISLGLTSTSLFAISYHHIQQRYFRNVPWWLGDRVACILDGVDSDELFGLFPEDELATFKDFCGDNFSIMRIIEESGKFKRARMHITSDACLSFWLMDDPEAAAEMVLDPFQLLEEFKIDHFCAETIIIKYLIKPFLVYDARKEWILCNLSKKAYVRANEVANATGQQPNGPLFGDHLTFTEVLVPYLCLEGDSRWFDKIRILDKDDYRRGPWTGDRFEITTVDRMDLTGWADVTDNTLKDVQRIWEHGRGENWRDWARETHPF